MTKKTAKQNTTTGVNLSLTELLDQYQLDLEAMNRSHKTISWYVEILQRYFAFLHSNHLLKPVDKLGTQELKAYILHLQQSDKWANNLGIKKPSGKLSPHSVQGHVRAVKAFWSWLGTEGYVDENPLAKFPLPKVPDKLVTVLTSEQIVKLLTNIDRMTPQGARYYAILLLLLDTGLRVSELASIKIEDLDLTHNCIQVLGKGTKWRVVPISKLTKKEMIRYVNLFRPKLCPAESAYLFPTAEGTHISVNSIQQFLRRLAGRSGLSQVRVSPHVFRHTFATQAMANGANVFALKEIMGHASLHTTMKYTHLQPHDLQLQHSTFSPVAKLAIAGKMK